MAWIFFQASEDSLRNSPKLATIFGSETSTGGRLNPVWAEWLMGYPPAWTELEGWAMQWFRPKRGKHLKDYAALNKQTS